jgi:hypothetical protein
MKKIIEKIIEKIIKMLGGYTKYEFSVQQVRGDLRLAGALAKVRDWRRGYYHLAKEDKTIRQVDKHLQELVKQIELSDLKNK